jgi:hypothetical protein
MTILKFPRGQRALAFGAAPLLLICVGLASPVSAATKTTKAVRQGSTCTKTQAGKRSGVLVCTKVGKVFTWTSTTAGEASPTVQTTQPGSTSGDSFSVAKADLAKAINNAVKPAGFTFVSTLCESATGDCAGDLFYGNDRGNLSIAGMSQAQWDLNQTLGLTKSSVSEPLLYANMGNGQLFLPMRNQSAVYPAYTLSVTGLGLSVPDGLARMAEIIRPIAPVLETISKK